MNYYLKTTDESSMWEALETAGLAVKDYDKEDELNVRPSELSPDTDWSPSGKFEWVFKGEALDVIGVIYTTTGNMLTDSEGFEYQEKTAVDGFHANIKAKAGINGLPTVSTPKTPYRKWAGE